MTAILKFFPKREDFEDCESCEWYFEHFDPQHLTTFWNTLRERVCVNTTYNAIPIKKTHIEHYDERMA